MTPRGNGPSPDPDTAVDNHRVRTGVVLAPDKTWRVVVEIDGRPHVSGPFSTESEADRRARRIARAMRRVIAEVTSHDR